MAFAFFAFASQTITIPGILKNNGTAVEATTTATPAQPLVAAR